MLHHIYTCLGSWKLYLKHEMETLIFKEIGEDPDPRHQSTRNNLVYFKIAIAGIVA